MKKTARQLRKESYVGQKRIRSGIFMVIVIGELALAGNLLRQAFFRPAPPPMAGNVIDVSASMSGFDQKEIHVKVGVPVTIRFTSLDNEHHTDGGGVVGMGFLILATV